MKALITISTLLCLNSYATFKPDYQCVADRMQAINSDIFYALTAEEIDAMITIPSLMGHELAVQMAKKCEMSKTNGTITAKGYACIASVLNIDNNQATIDSMLTINEYAGHLEAVDAAIACAIY